LGNEHHIYFKDVFCSRAKIEGNLNESALFSQLLIGIDLESDNSLDIFNDTIQEFYETKSQLASLVCIENVLRVGYCAL
jgi:hypothetical protein